MLKILKTKKKHSYALKVQPSEEENPKKGGERSRETDVERYVDAGQDLGRGPDYLEGPAGDGGESAAEATPVGLAAVANLVDELRGVPVRARVEPASAHHKDLLRIGAQA